LDLVPTFDDGEVVWIVFEMKCELKASQCLEKVDIRTNKVRRSAITMTIRVGVARSPVCFFGSILQGTQVSLLPVTQIDE
jgi:hypothetical protein